jgi:hypothetical protein
MFHYCPFCPKLHTVACFGRGQFPPLFATATHVRARGYKLATREGSGTPGKLRGYLAAVVVGHVFNNTHTLLQLGITPNGMIAVDVVAAIRGA